MPMKMTAAQYEAALDEIAERQPPEESPYEAAQAYGAVSYSLSVFGDALNLRLIDARGRTQDIKLSQPMAVSLITHLTQACQVVDWMDSTGKPSFKPS
ncbi:hypothetical protein ACEUZ9_001576 [Paracoccus litorisediminis]|jgi:hypothetical protein|uniref:Uncharacterized protein n=1 Tax=Paracoccus litorisediminis TaxID=2006130 RepID=A0A844HIN7_9RHOB|nr:hypothetical protein [Paracoccus litorisediminis]MTH57661.1 hypothetical protein [Paracoccus litorisediminis]